MPPSFFAGPASRSYSRRKWEVLLMAQAPYIKLLNARARSAFKERRLLHYKPTLWLDDQGWWTSVVEFQSSKAGDGALLNVGLCWLFYPKDFLSFDIGYREIEFTPYGGDAEFAPIADRFVERAVRKVDDFRNALRSTATAWSFVNRHSVAESDDLWRMFHKGVLAGLAGDEISARSLLEAVASAPQQWDWERERARRAQGLLSPPAGLRTMIRELVNEARRSLRLPARDVALE
jgi:hypothetical protein